MRRKVLITGGMGFIGTAMTLRFAESSAVTVADRLDFGMSEALAPLIRDGRVEFVETDLGEVSDLHRRVAAGEFEVIVHLAALTHIPLCEAHPDFAYRSNVISALNLISRLPARCKLVNFSSSSTYAPDLRPHVEDTSPIQPCDIYGWTKKHVEDLAHYYAERNGLGIVTIRPANAVGFGETNPKLLGTIFQQLAAGTLALELGSLTPRRDFIHVDDIAWVVEHLVEVWPVEPGRVETFNVGTGYPPVSVEEVARRILELAGRPTEIRSVTQRRRRAERELLVPDVTKLRRTLPDFCPKRIDEWLPDVVKNPGLRLTNRIEARLQGSAHGA